MKKRLCIAALIVSAAMLFGSCRDSSTQDKSDALINAIVNDINDNAAAQPAQTTKPAGTAKISQSAETTTSAELQTTTFDTFDYTEELINIDLTTMNATMIYSVIYDITVNPDNYYGKRLLLDGYFDTMYEERLDTRYYFIVVPDATACCMQGLEFIPETELTYPDDYPTPGQDIRIVGVLDRYEEEGNNYIYIRAEHMELRN